MSPQPLKTYVEPLKTYVGNINNYVSKKDYNCFKNYSHFNNFFHCILRIIHSDYVSNFGSTVSNVLNDPKGKTYKYNKTSYTFNITDFTFD